MEKLRTLFNHLSSLFKYFSLSLRCYRDTFAIRLSGARIVYEADNWPEQII